MTTFFHSVKFLALVFIGCAFISIALIKNGPIISVKQEDFSCINVEYGESKKVDFNHLTSWANNLDSLRLEDKQRIDLLFDHFGNFNDVRSLRKAFYKYVNHPLHSVCKVGKFFGGQWQEKHGCLDGHKFVCLDDLYVDVMRNNCLIYSFGLSNDWSFEENMLGMGCTVRSFDPTIDGQQKPKSDLITFQKIGLAETNLYDINVGNLVTLSEAIKLMNDTERRISYLKVDIEGSERLAMSEWIDSGAINEVSQIGIEIHTDVPRPLINSTLTTLVQTFRRLHTAGFRLISTTNNECIGKKFDYLNRYHTLFELVFYKPQDVTSA